LPHETDLLSEKGDKNKAEEDSLDLHSKIRSGTLTFQNEAATFAYKATTVYES